MLLKYKTTKQLKNLLISHQRALEENPFRQNRAHLNNEIKEIKEVLKERGQLQ